MSVTFRSIDDEEKEGGSSNVSIDEDKHKDKRSLDVYTVEEVVDKMGFGLFQFGVTMFAGATWPSKFHMKAHVIDDKNAILNHLAQKVVEAFEVMLLSILSSAVKCEWDLEDVEEALITMVVFLGVLIGAPIWGLLADTFGRKWTMFSVNIYIFLTGLLSAFSPNYGSLLLLRGLVGLGVGGAFVGPTYCAEFLPTRIRATVMVLLEFFWAFGAILEAILAMLVMTNIDDNSVNWRWLLGLSAVPVGLLTFIFPFMLESPRYLVQKGDVKRATKILARVSLWNGCELPPGQLVTHEEKERIIAAEQGDPANISKSYSIQTDDVRDDVKHQSYGTINSKFQKEAAVSDSIRITSEKSPLLDSSKLPSKTMIKKQIKIYCHWVALLFKNGWWKTTLLLWFLWASAQIIYFGAILLTTTLFEEDEHCGLTEDKDNSTCDPLTKSDYIHIIWTTTAEIPGDEKESSSDVSAEPSSVSVVEIAEIQKGLLLVLVLLYVMGRKYAMALQLMFCAIFFSLLYVCAGKAVLTLFLFVIRAFATGYFQAVYLYTPEVYPTMLRSFGMSMCSSASRLGAMASPFIPQTILPANENAAIGIYVCLSVVSIIASLLLPIETRGRTMKDTATR